MEDKQIWGIHMPRSEGTKPTDQSYIAIGWSAVGNLGKIASTREAFKAAVASAYPNFTPGAVPVHAGTLFKFVHDMKIGDWIAYPSKIDRMINLGEIKSAYIFDPKSSSQYPNRRKVKWVRSIAREEFSQSALNEIGSAVTLFQIKNNIEEFVAAFHGTQIAEETLDSEVVEAASEATLESTTDFVLKSLKSKLSPAQFESFVAHLLERMDYHARVTQLSGDGGVDIIAHTDELGFEPPIIKVQCKQTFGGIGEPLVAQLYGHVKAPREFGLFVTLGEYSPQAKQFERNNQNLRLINGTSLVELIFNHYDSFEPRYQVLLPLKKVYIPQTVIESV